MDSFIHLHVASFLPLLCSVPMVADLLETCIDEVIRAPVVPTVTAAEEAGPSSAYSTSSISGDEGPSLSGEASENCKYSAQTRNENYSYILFLKFEIMVKMYLSVEQYEPMHQTHIVQSDHCTHLTQSEFTRDV